MRDLRILLKIGVLFGSDKSHGKFKLGIKAKTKLERNRGKTEAAST